MRRLGRKARIGMFGGGLLTAAVLSSVSLGFSTYLIEPIREAGVPASLEVGEVVDAFRVVPEESAGFSLCRDGFLSDSQIFETETIAFDIVCDPLLRDERFLTNGYLRVNLELTETGGNLISSGTVSFEPFVNGAAAGTAETSGSSILVAGVELDIASRLEFEVSFRLSIPDLASYQDNFQSQLDAAPRFALGLEAVNG